MEGHWRHDPRQACNLLEDESFCPPELREFTWGFYRHLCEPNRAVLRGHEDAVHSVAWSPTEETLHDRHYELVRTVAFSGDGKLLASSGDDLDQPIILWDPATRQPLLTLRGHTDAVVALVFSPDNTTLASAANSHDPTGRLWDVRSGRLIATLPGSEDYLSALAWSPDSQMLVFVDGHGCVRKWDGMAQRLADLADSGTGE